MGVPACYIGDEKQPRSTKDAKEEKPRARALQLGSCKLALDGQVLRPTEDLASSGVEAGALMTLIVIPTSFFLLTSSADCIAKLWSIETGACTQTFAAGKACAPTLKEALRRAGRR